LLTGGQLPKATSDRIVTALDALPSYGVLSNKIERIHSTIYLMLTVPSGAVQK
jgi:hypothetical protein